MKDFILKTLAEVRNGYSLCGLVDRRARIYPLGSDTKVIGTLFEIVVRQAVVSYAESSGLRLVEPAKQNHYPDFTLMRGENDRDKIALDVKTTYRREGQSRFAYTLGSYTSYIRPETEGMRRKQRISSFPTANTASTGLSGLSINEPRGSGTQAAASIRSTHYGKSPSHLTMLKSSCKRSGGSRETGPEAVIRPMSEASTVL